MARESQDARLLFLALDTWSRVGGLQRFNQRAASALAAFAEEGGFERLRMHVMRDTERDLPTHLNAELIGFGPSRIGFIQASLTVARKSDILLLGQINLLPIGWIAKKVNPDIRVVLFVHGIDVWNDPNYRRRRAYEPTLLSSVDRISSVSRYTAEVMEREFRVPSEKFFICPNAVDGPLHPRHQPAEEPVLLCVTRMSSHDHGKHVDSVLMAFSKVVRKVHGARLEIVGDGPLRASLESLVAALGIANSVHFLGRVGEEQLEACYRRASAFVLPSSKEGFGIVYLEAWKYGLPVICGDRGASHELVSHGQDGFVVNPSDIDALAGCIAGLLLDPMKGAAMGARGMEKVASGYLDKHFRKNLKKMLRSLR